MVNFTLLYFVTVYLFLTHLFFSHKKTFTKFILIELQNQVKGDIPRYSGSQTLKIYVLSEFCCFYLIWGNIAKPLNVDDENIFLKLFVWSNLFWSFSKAHKDLLDIEKHIVEQQLITRTAKTTWATCCVLIWFRYVYK